MATYRIEAIVHEDGPGKEDELTERLEAALRDAGISAKEIPVVFEVFFYGG